jgi:hypothetical protein
MSDNSYNGGFSFASNLFLIFLVLKLTNYIDWSWWWVTSPLWISTLIMIFLIGLIVIFKK